MIELAGETFGGSYPFAPHYREVNGVALHYVDEGAGAPVLLVHGDPTWGYLWRAFVPVLARRHRCIVPDHMGMGKSAGRKELFPYRLAHHVANLEGLLLGLDLRDVTLVLHDWGGPVGLGVAVRHPERIRRLCLMNTWAFAPWPGPPLPRLLQLIRSERGERFVLERNGYVEAALTGTTHHPERLSRAVLDAYLAPYPTPESRLALLGWTRDIPLAEGEPSFAEMRRIEAGLAAFRDRPVLLAWGLRDPVLPGPVLRRWQAVFPQAETVALEDASHFLQEDAPGPLVDRVAAFLEGP